MVSSSFSSRNWVYDVFPSFCGVDVRITFLSHFLKELDRKLIIAFKDNEIERSQSLNPKLKQAIRDSRNMVVVLSENYPSSSWCLNELLEIMKCKNEFDQTVIPVFYRLDPSHVRNQTGDFGNIFEKTCHNQTEEVKIEWKRALTDVANVLGYHSKTWDNEATMIESIANDILGKLLLTPSKDFENFVGIENHIAKMSVLLHLESEKVRMVGIWGSSGIGKTTIARVLYNRLSRHFQGSVYIDRRFIFKSMEVYSKGNLDDYNMKLHLQENFLSKLLDRNVIEVGHLGAVRGKLKDMKVLIFIDDLDEHVVLDTLVGGNDWFGPGSRIIVITKDKQILRGHGIKCIYEVGIPSERVALQIFCRSAFRQNSPPDGFMELASKVAMRAGGLPLGLNLLGSSMRERNKKYWVDMIPTLRKGVNKNIEKALRVSYDALEKEDKVLFRHIACFFNGEEIKNIKLVLADSELNVDRGLVSLVDKSLIHIIPSLDTNIVEMHCLLEEMGKEIVRAQSDKPARREFLIDSNDVCDVLEKGTGSGKVIGISLDIYETDELWIHKKAFKGMRNLRFLNFYTTKWDHKKEVRWHLRKGFNYFPTKLKLLRLDGYPMKCMPSKFSPENLVKLQMQGSKLEKLWEGVHSLTRLREMDLRRSTNLTKIPDLSMATNLEILDLTGCLNLVELPSSIQYLNKLTDIDMAFCESLEILPTGMNLRSLNFFDLRGCSRLRSFPDISTNISMLILSDTAIEEFPFNMRLQNLVALDMATMKSNKLWNRVQPLTPLMNMLSPSLTSLWLSDIPSLVELPSSLQNLHNLKELCIRYCINLVTLPTSINLKSLDLLALTRCPRLVRFPDISTNVSELFLSETGIEEVPWWIEKFHDLIALEMWGCKHLKSVSLNISKLKHLEKVNFSYCGALSTASLNDSPRAVAMATCNTHYDLQVSNKASSYHTADDYIPHVLLNFSNCFSLDQEALLHQQTLFQELILSGEEVPPYFSHRTTGTSSSLTIPLLHTSPSHPFFRFRACMVVDFAMMSSINIQLFCRFKGRSGNHFDCPYQHPAVIWEYQGMHLVIFDCYFPLDKDNDPLAEVNYDHVDIRFHMSSGNAALKLNGCGIRIFEGCFSGENRFGNYPKTLPRVCEADMIINGCHETEHGEECRDRCVEAERSKKRIRIT